MNQSSRWNDIAAALRTADNLSPTEIEQLRKQRDRFEAQKFCNQHPDFELSPARLSFARWLATSSRISEDVEA